MLENETTKHHWLRIGAIALITFIVAFIAFYCVMELMLHRMTDPMYNAKRIEKIMQKQEKSFQKIEDRMTKENPFEPTMRPMLVNLVKENNEYKVIVDLKPLENNEKDVNVNIKDHIITVSGELDEKLFGSQKIINFSQSYYLDEDLEKDKITKEKKGDKYIITIPFE
ncbi:MAG: Hsp20/alpha crystallin family protein [Candidatus Gastranaerophilales bacterium]|nr:Hsp20/alpha crystallin family protein [Candidatus Gastranaerophilales bacterium]